LSQPGLGLLQRGFGLLHESLGLRIIQAYQYLTFFHALAFARGHFHHRPKHDRAQMNPRLGKNLARGHHPIDDSMSLGGDDLHQRTPGAMPKKHHDHGQGDEQQRDSRQGHELGGAMFSHEGNNLRWQGSQRFERKDSNLNS